MNLKSIGGSDKIIMAKKMYEVSAKCGHVGRGYYVEKVFAVKADSAKDAAAMVRQFPRVKHHHKDAIRYVELIDESRFMEIREVNQQDPYMICQSKQEQNKLCRMTLKLKKEEDREIRIEEGKHQYNRKRSFLRDKEIRKEKQYINLNNVYGEYVA